MAGSARAVPDFIIIGAMKSGTTTLYQYLCQHADIFMTTPKEPGYFSRNEVYQKGPEWYLSLFANARPGQKIGEASTCYSRWPTYAHVPERIFKSNPKTKLIYLLRHPVDRAYSHYGHLRFYHDKTYPSFEDALVAEPEIVDASKYMCQIEQFLQFFPKEQLYLVDFDGLIANPKDAVNEILAFIGCNEINLSFENGIKANEAGETSLKRKMLASVYKIRRFPIIKQLVDVLLPKQFRKGLARHLVNIFFSSRLGHWLVKHGKAELPPLQSDTRSHLLQELKDDTQALEVFWGRNIRKWYL